jgi:hypothetical protein
MLARSIFAWSRYRDPDPIMVLFLRIGYSDTSQMSKCFNFFLSKMIED